MVSTTSSRQTGAYDTRRHDRSSHSGVGATVPVHLTRRGRLVLLAALVAVLFGAFSLGRSATEAAPEAQTQEQAQPAIERVTVQAGESLWSLAVRIAPDHDPREVVAQLRRLNDLSDSQLLVGQQLLLPVAA